MKVAFATLGCRTNQHDTAEMQTLLERDGFSIVDAGDRADVYVINTCTVTRKSDHGSRLAVKKSLGINEDALVIFTGCYAQTDPEEATRIPGLDLILGNADKLAIAAAIKNLSPGEPRAEKRAKPQILMSDIAAKREFKTVPVTSFQGRTKAFIKVQTGCDERCSFCTVVRARGRSISDSRENILNNVKSAIAAGYKEITLSGINMGAYGMDRSSPDTFSSLAREVVALEGNFRVRLSSINPMEIDDDLIRLVAGNEKLCPHFHIPLQSGDDTVLARMRRNYNSRQYVDVVNRIADKIPVFGLGADVIVGFPGETDAMFKNTLELVAALPFSYLHTFTYSARKGTEACGFKDAIPKTVKKERNATLAALAKDKSLEFRRRFLDRTVSVLVERQRDPVSGALRGYSEHYVHVTLEGDDSLSSQIVPVSIAEVTDCRVSGCVRS